MTPHDHPKTAPADQPGDDFRQIAGIGAAIERRLHDAGIPTYRDLASRSPEQIAASLADVAGISAARIARQDWVGQASKLAGPPAQPLPSEPNQHYASFHIELLLDVDDSVRRTKVHHHQSDMDEAWPGWDEDRLLALLREHVPLIAARQPEEAADISSSAEPEAAQPEMVQPPAARLEMVRPEAARPEMVRPEAARPEAATPSGDQMEAADLPMSLPASSVRVENLGLTRAGQSAHSWAPGESTSIRFTLRVDRTSSLQAATLDFAADVAASSELGDDQRWPLGTAQGAVGVDEPLSVELAGQPLPPGLYRLKADVLIYPAGHVPDSPPLGSRRRSGAFITVADALAQAG